MSDNKTNTPASPVYTVGAAEDVATKENFFQRRVVTPIKSHPKVAIAIAAGVGLVASAALAGRKSAQYDVVLELQPTDDLPEETVTVIDTSSSDE